MVTGTAIVILILWMAWSNRCKKCGSLRRKTEHFGDGMPEARVERICAKCGDVKRVIYKDKAPSRT